MSITVVALIGFTISSGCGRGIPSRNATDMNVTSNVTEANVTPGHNNVSNTNITETSIIQMIVTINGLGKDEEAVLRIFTETYTGLRNDPGRAPVFEKFISGTGDAGMTVEISPKLANGYYKLMLQAPEKYYRAPMGYFFWVRQSQIENTIGKPIIFKLVPPPHPVGLEEEMIGLSPPPTKPTPPPSFK